jgi:hypothetical protein
MDFPSSQQAIAKYNVEKGKLLIVQVNSKFYDNSIQRRQRSRAKLNRIIATTFSYLGVKSEFNTFAYGQSDTDISALDLTGAWAFKTDPNRLGEDAEWQKSSINATKKLIVPGTWESQGITEINPNLKSKRPYDGLAWYQKEMIVPGHFKNLDLYFQAGSIDDFDHVYFNGDLIGHTGKDTVNYWKVRRQYAIPADLIRYDKSNMITIKVDDVFMAGGISKGPVQLSTPPLRHGPYLDAHLKAHERFDPYHFHRW